MPDTQEKLTEIYDAQIYGGKQKGSLGDRKTLSKRYMRGRERRDRESCVYRTNEERGINSP